MISWDLHTWREVLNLPPVSVTTDRLNPSENPHTNRLVKSSALLLYKSEGGALQIDARYEDGLRGIVSKLREGKIV